MAERLPELTGEKSVLPTTAPKVKSPDLLSKFLAAREARPEFMTDTLVQTMAVSMAFAGSETTAISLSAVFYFLLKNPHTLARLREEIDESGRKGLFSDLDTGLVTWTESQKLPYLDACVKEAFRLHPAAGLPLERIVPEPGMEICGHFVKGGTIVGCSAWIIHMNKEVFGEDVEVYRPERWLVDETKVREKEEQRIKEMNGTMFQFGMGSRTCIGKNISLLEVYKLVPSMLRRFEVSNHPAYGWLRDDANGMKQIQFKDPRQEWELVNAWFVKQKNFTTMFSMRDIVKPDNSLDEKHALEQRI
jgi:cytochrome P450